MKKTQQLLSLTAAALLLVGCANDAHEEEGGGREAQEVLGLFHGGCDLV